VLLVDGAEHNDPDLLTGARMIDAVVELATRSGCPPAA
jgi:hypothetical protein